MKKLVVVCLGLLFSGCGKGPANEGELLEEQLYGPQNRATEKIDALTKGLEGQARIDALIRALDEEDLLIYAVAQSALAGIGVDAVPRLIEALDHQSGQVRAGAAYALRDIGPDAKAAVPALTKFLKNQDAHARQVAAQALGNIGSDAKTAIPTLRQAIQDEDETVRRLAREALKKIQPRQTR